jgi:hypothetical protein
MPNPVERFANVPKDYSNFLSVVKCLTEFHLLNRKQRVVINGCCSDWQNVCAGVPQGSILGPLFFKIYINDIVADINSSIKLFADDIVFI